MVFNIREYKCSFSGQKGEEELAIAAKMMNLINNNAFDSIDDIVKYNGSLNEFLKNQHFTNVVKHFGSALKEIDYNTVIDNFKQLTKQKLDFEKESIHTTKIERSEYNEYNGVVLNNTENDKSIEDQMKEIQLDRKEFHTTDKEKNTEEMMNELQKKKQIVDFVNLNEINTNLLNEDEMKIYNAALIKQFIQKKSLKINIQEQLIMDDENNISKVFSNENESVIKGNENDSLQQEITETSIQYLNEIDKDLLSATQADIYDAAVNYQLATNEIIRLDLKNMLIINENNETKEIIEEDGILVVNDERMLKQNSGNNLSHEKEKVKVLELIRPNYQETLEAA